MNAALRTGASATLEAEQEQPHGHAVLVETCRVIRPPGERLACSGVRARTAHPTLVISLPELAKYSGPFPSTVARRPDATGTRDRPPDYPSWPTGSSDSWAGNQCTRLTKGLS